MPKTRAKKAPAKAASKAAASQTKASKGAASTARKRRVSLEETPIPKRRKPQHSLNYPPSKILDVFAFGNGENGELGLGAMMKKERELTVAPYPYQVETLDPNTVGVVEVAAGGMHSAVLTRDGRIFTWGVNDNKALGRNTKWEEPPEGRPEDMSDLNPLESTPAPVCMDTLGSAPLSIAQVAVCDSATFALTDDGRVFGWGSFRASDGLFGFLRSSITSKYKPKESEQLQEAPVFVAGLPPIKFISCGANHVLALTHTGDVLAWGCGEQFELGRRIIERRRYEALVPRSVGLRGKNVTRIYAGFNHSFAIGGSGTVYAWGLNNFGQTGIPASDDELTVFKPTIVKSLASYNIKHIAGGSHHSIACTEEGKVLVWGRCDDCQMGVAIDDLPRHHLVLDSAERPRILNVPTVVPGVKAVFVAAGIDNSMAITEDGKLYAWGFSSEFRTGLGTEDSVETPTQVKRGDAVNSTLTYVGGRGQFSVAAGMSMN